MAASRQFGDFIAEMLTPLGTISVRRMFGGAGVYLDDTMFALIADDVLYLKAADEHVAAFEAEGCAPFVYTARGTPRAMSYWQAPERLYDDAEEMIGWARRAHRAALASRRTRRPRR